MNNFKKEILKSKIKIKKLNAIPENRPANRNSILESNLSKMTRKLLGKEK